VTDVDEPGAGCRILVAGIGNVFRSDDGFGCEVARRLAGQPWPDGVRVVDYGIRGMHLAYDLLDPWDSLVLIDAVPDRGEPGTVVLVEIAEDDVASGRGDGPVVDAHGMDPATVLAGLAALGGRLPARTFLVGCQVAETADGMGLTPRVEAAVDAAAHTARALVQRLRPVEVG
jgi:hydrogenase maturation protease